MKLTTAQVRYLQDRISDIFDEKKRVATKALGAAPPPDESILNRSVKEKMDLIFSGKATLKKRNEVGMYTNICDAFDFPIPKDQAKFLGLHQKWNEKAEAIQKKLNLEQQQVMDKLMLSENAESALAVVNALESNGK